MSVPTAEEVAAETLSSWETNAAFWDESIGPDGNLYWKVLQEPCLGRLLGEYLKPGCYALDLATGNGLCARWMAAQGAYVVATDGTEAMLEVARARLAADDPGVQSLVRFQQIDVTKPDQLGSLMAGVRLWAVKWGEWSDR